MFYNAQDATEPVLCHSCPQRKTNIFNQSTLLHSHKYLLDSSKSHLLPASMQPAFYLAARHLLLLLYVHSLHNMHGDLKKNTVVMSGDERELSFRHLAHDRKVKVLVAQSCPTLCDPMDCSLPVSICSILQARILEWEEYFHFYCSTCILV